MTKNYGGRISTSGLAGAIDGEGQDGGSDEKTYCKKKCERCGCALSQSSLKRKLRHCMPCVTLLRDEAYAKGKSDPFKENFKRRVG